MNVKHFMLFNFLFNSIQPLTMFLYQAFLKCGSALWTNNQHEDIYNRCQIMLLSTNAKIFHFCVLFYFYCIANRNENSIYSLLLSKWSLSLAWFCINNEMRLHFLVFATIKHSSNNWKKSSIKSKVSYDHNTETHQIIYLRM